MLNDRPTLLIAASLVVAGALITCGWLIRDGLLAVSTEVRNKQVSPLPAEIHLGVANPDIKVTLGSIRIDGAPLGSGSGAATSGTLSIENLKIEVPASQPVGGGR